MSPERKALVFALVLGIIAIASFIFFISGGLALFLDSDPETGLVLIQRSGGLF